MPSNEDLYDTYLRAASAAEQSERVGLLTTIARPDFEIISPFPYVVSGIEAVAAQLGQVAAAMPGGSLHLQRTSVIDSHNSIFRALYENRGPGGETLSSGLHVVETRDGRLVRILVFVPADQPAPRTD